MIIPRNCFFSATLLILASSYAASAAAATIADANVGDFPRFGGETDDSPRFQRAVNAAANGVLSVPKGDYEIATPLVITNRCSLEMHPAAVLRAVRKMDFVLTWDGCGDCHSLVLFDGNGRIYDNLGLFISGGEIDGDGLASCLRLGNAHHFLLSNITLRNGRKIGLEVTRRNKAHLYELVANNVYCKCSKSGLAGNVGVDCQVGDCHFTDVFVVDYTIGIRVGDSANRLTRCHVWGGTVPPKGMDAREWSEFYAANKRKRRSMHGIRWTKEDEDALVSKGVPEMLEKSIAFQIDAGACVLDGCYADTAEIGFLVNANVTIVHSGFFNNPLMGLRKSTAIVHRRGRLVVGYCDFRGASGCEKLYEGCCENVVWENSTAAGGAGMDKEPARFSR